VRFAWPRSIATVSASAQFVIAERHSQQRSESARMLAKGLQGCSYFISQTVYQPHATERLLRDYLRDCRGAGVEPRRRDPYLLAGGTGKDPRFPAMAGGARA
jgi:hypothetical protein